jgi:NACHT conflict system protein
VRDSFSKQTITEIAKGVAYRCSNPECGRPTVAANAAQDGTVIIGVAAHICAASAGGPRYNSGQTSERRRAKANGIWLCQNCARLIDVDADKFTVVVLEKWKHDAQDRAFRDLVAPNAPGPFDEPARLRGMIAGADTGDRAFDRAFERMHKAAIADLGSFTRPSLWSRDPVELTLRLSDDPERPPFTISKLPLAIEVAPEVAIVAAPGTGKTTTVLQLASKVLSSNSIVPLFFRLSDRVAGSPRLLKSIRQRTAFRNVSDDEVHMLAERGRLLLLLDGWNEIDESARKELRLNLDQIRREYPNVRVLVTTRRQMLDVPVSGPRLNIELLSEDQQLAIARAQLGAAGEKIVDDAWRTAGVRELVGIPLYLSALLAGATRGVKPVTKEEILRLFVEQHERASDHAEALQVGLLGCHSQVLTALAARLNEQGVTSMNEVDARRIITETLTKLREQGQLATSPEPRSVLELLINRHAVTRSGNSNDVIAFQHQQFQEWFASHEVEQTMRGSANKDIGAQMQLRGSILDRPAWEESILFTIERVSRQEGGGLVSAHAVRVALPVDPMLAADMIYRASPAVWEILKADVLKFIKQWHRPSTVDRAVRFMIMTGRPEFEPIIWPLVSSADSQVQLSALRIAPRFRPSVLGPNIASKIDGLSEQTREHLLTSIATQSGVDGLELATELAKRDGSPKLQAEMIAYLQFRRADRHAASLLNGASDETWALVAKRGYIEEIRDPALVSRLQVEREKLLAKATEPLERLRLLLDQPPSYPGWASGIAGAIADPRFPVRDQLSGTSLYYAQKRAPAAVLDGLRQRLVAGLELPFHTDDFLNKMDVEDGGTIASRILDTSEDDRRGDAIASLAGPNTIKTLIERILTCQRAQRADRTNRQLADEYHRLRSRISATRVPQFIAALISHADTSDIQVIATLATLVSVHGNNDGRRATMPVDATVKGQMIDILRSWVKTVVKSPAGTRYQLCEVSNAIGRFGFAELLPELKWLIDEDLSRLRKARQAFPDALKRGDIEATSDARMRYGNQYGAALSRIGGDGAAAVAAEYLEDRTFGFDAALALKSISDKQLDSPEPDWHRRWPWLSEVAAARAKRADPNASQPANALAAPIFAAIDRLSTSETDKEGQHLAINLARIALAMPHTNQDALMERVVALPQPLSTKRELFGALTMDGQVIDASVLMQAIDEWVRDAEKDETAAWHKRQNTWEIEPWLELLPFSTRPDAVFEGLTKVKAFYGVGWKQRWERVLTAVAAVSGSEGNGLLEKLARTHGDIAGEYEWMKAFLSRDSELAVLSYIDLYMEGIFGQGPHAVDAWHAGRTLAPYVQRLPQLRVQLQERYKSAASAHGQAMLEHLFGEIGDREDILLMVEKYAANTHPYDGRMASAIRAVALRNEPVQDGSSAYYTYPASVSGIRQSLFTLHRGKVQEASLAERCLIEIDVLRDEYGIAAGDARHPDVMTGLPWPKEAPPA